MQGEIPSVVEQDEASASPAPDAVGTGEVLAPEPPPPLPEPRGRRRSGRSAILRIEAVLALGGVVAAVALITTSTLRRASAQPGAPAASRPALKVTRHHVRPGDTLGTIAARYHSSVAILEQLNPNLNPQALRPGQTLRIGTIQ